MESDLRLLLRSKIAADIVGNYGLGEALADPEAVPGLTNLQRQRLLSIKTVTHGLTSNPKLNDPITSSRDVFERYRFKYGIRDKERFVVLCLSSRNTITGEVVVATGSVNTVHVNPVDVLRAVVISGSPNLLVVHNHPSGDPSPSQEDKALTERLQRAATLMGVRLLDHIILTSSSSYYSFSDSGEI